MITLPEMPHCDTMMQWRPMTTLWAIDLKSELVFVGDEGTTESRGPTRRRGIEAALRGQVWGPIYINGSITW